MPNGRKAAKHKMGKPSNFSQSVYCYFYGILMICFTIFHSQHRGLITRRLNCIIAYWFRLSQIYLCEFLWFTSVSGHCIFIAHYKGTHLLCQVQFASHLIYWHFRNKEAKCALPVAGTFTPRCINAVHLPGCFCVIKKIDINVHSLSKYSKRFSSEVVGADCGKKYTIYRNRSAAPAFSGCTYYLENLL